MDDEVLEICILRSDSSKESDNSCFCLWNFAFLSIGGMGDWNKNKPEQSNQKAYQNMIHSH